MTLASEHGKKQESPSIIIKINPPLHSAAESINNVAAGENLHQKLYSDIVDFYSLACDGEMIPFAENIQGAFRSFQSLAGARSIKSANL